MSYDSKNAQVQNRPYYWVEFEGVPHKFTTTDVNKFKIDFTERYTRQAYNTKSMASPSLRFPDSEIMEHKIYSGVNMPSGYGLWCDSIDEGLIASADMHVGAVESNDYFEITYEATGRAGDTIDIMLDGVLIGTRAFIDDEIKVRGMIRSTSGTSYPTTATMTVAFNRPAAGGSTTGQLRVLEIRRRNDQEVLRDAFTFSEMIQLPEGGNPEVFPTEGRSTIGQLSLTLGDHSGQMNYIMAGERPDDRSLLLKDIPLKDTILSTDKRRGYYWNFTDGQDAWFKMLESEGTLSYVFRGWRYTTDLREKRIGSGSGMKFFNPTDGVTATVGEAKVFSTEKILLRRDYNYRLELSAFRTITAACTLNVTIRDLDSMEKVRQSSGSTYWGHAGTDGISFTLGTSASTHVLNIPELNVDRNVEICLWVDGTDTQEWSATVQTVKLSIIDAANVFKSIYVADVEQFQPGGYIYIGRETFYYTGNQYLFEGGQIWGDFQTELTGVTRAVLGSDYGDHARSVEVYGHPPFMKKRRATLYGNFLGENYTQKRALFTGYIEEIQMEDDMNSWTIEIHDTNLELDKDIFVTEPLTVLAGGSELHGGIASRDASGKQCTVPYIILQKTKQEIPSYGFMEIGSEIVKYVLADARGFPALFLIRRGMYGTEVTSQIEPGAECKLLMIASEDQFSFFKEVGDNPIDIMETLLGVDNVLPSGWSGEVRSDLIDTTSLSAEKDKWCLNYRMNFMIRDKFNLKSFLENEICRQVSGYLFVKTDGKIGIKVMGSPIPTEQPVSDLSWDKAIEKPVTTYGMRDYIGAVQYTVGEGGPSSLNLNVAYLRSLEFYPDSREAIQISSSGLQPVGAFDRPRGGASIAYRSSQRILHRYSRQLSRLEIPVDFREHGREVGSLISYTDPHAVVSDSPVRGADDRKYEVVSKQMGWSDGTVELTAIDMNINSDRYTVIAPSAAVGTTGEVVFDATTSKYKREMLLNSVFLKSGNSLSSFFYPGVWVRAHSPDYSTDYGLFSLEAASTIKPGDPLDFNLVAEEGQSTTLEFPTTTDILELHITDWDSSYLSGMASSDGGFESGDKTKKWM